MSTTTNTANDGASLVSQWPHTLMDNYGTPPVGLVSGKGAILVGEDGKEYIDLLAGIAVNSLGHAHPEVVEAVTQQISSLGHVSNLFASAPAVTAAQKLKERVGDDSARVLFCNSGAEANEAAFKIARLTGRTRILAAQHGFHGRTMGSLSMTGQPGKRKAFEPMPMGVEFYPYGDLDYVRKLVEINPNDTAAIILEPIQGETGVIPAPEGFLAGLREICDEYGILLMVDEVQTGAGRTGDFFGYESSGIVPDVITMAKGLGAGLPIGACIGVGKAAGLFTPGTHGTTFGGNPVVCAAANVVLDLLDDTFLAGVAAKGEKFRQILEKSPHIMQIRGRGLMLGLVLNTPVAKDAVARGLDNGVILNAPAADVLRITPPLIISEQEIERAAGTIIDILKELG